MKYYTKQRKFRVRPIVMIALIIVILFYLISYIFDKRIYQGVLELSKTTITSRTTDVINETSTELFSNKFKYNEMVIINKDKDENINLIQVNTAELNDFTAKLSTEANKKLMDIGKVPIKVPLGWLTDNSVFYNLGPKVSVKVAPVGNIKVSYESKFEDAGLNQTRHKIYLNVEANVKIVMPLHSEEMLVNSQIPISETIIVGKIPNTSIDFGKNEIK